jgi:hypothetical protein
VLTGEIPLMLPPQRTVLEIVEGIDIDDEIVAGCRKLVDAGWTRSAKLWCSPAPRRSAGGWR